jgi:uncharacterized protein
VKRAFFLGFLLLLTTWAQGQTVPPEPILGQGSSGIEAPLTAPIPETFNILAIGDALGGGLGAGLTRFTEGGGRYEVTNRFNESSGIARPEVYDWTDAVGKITEGKTFKAAVILIGSNDRQDIRLGQFRYAFSTPDWVGAYKLQVDTLVDRLKAQNIQVYWVSIPPMADPPYDADMKMLNGLIKERVTAKGESFIDLTPAFSAADGSYTDKGTDDTGTVRRLRSRDGVGFYKEGNNRMAQLVLAAIEERQKGGITPAVPAGSTPPAFPDTPVLGQSLGGGASETFETADIADALIALQQKAAAQAAQKTDQAAVPARPLARIIDFTATPGSAAEKLITTGLADAAPAGRFDDFRVTAPAP